MFLIDFEPVRSHTVTTTHVTYDIAVPKPFCGGASDFVKLQGPVTFTMSVSTGPTGRYERTYSLGGTLRVTPLAPVPGPPVPASVFEIHQATLDEPRGQVTEKTQQSLLGEPFQSLAWSFAAGGADQFVRKVVCSAE
jgi:hypothetical protein